MRLTIARRMALGFTVVVLLIIAMSIGGAFSANSVVRARDDATYFSAARQMFTYREVDHLNWITELQEAFLNNTHEVTATTDHQKCNLGEWYYSPESRELADRDPEIARMLKALEQPHRKLHESAGAIRDTWRPMHAGLRQALSQIEVAHLMWAQTLSDAILNQANDVQVNTDPTTCDLGQYLRSEQFRAWSTDYPQIAREFETMRPAHDTLHASAAEISELLQANRFEDARQVFSQKTTPALGQVQAKLAMVIEHEKALEQARARALEILNTQSAEHLNDLQTIMHEIDARLVELSETSAAGVDESLEQMGFTNLVLAILGVVFAIVAGFLVTRSITRPVHTLLANFTRVSEGDLTVRSESKATDEIGELTRGFDTLTRTLNNIIVEVNGAATEVAGAATEVASSSEEMSAGIEEQTAQLDQVTSATVEMAGSAAEVARQAGDATKTAGEAGALAEQGGTIVRDTIEGMHSIEHAVTTSATNVAELGRRGEQIGAIINVINDIADQTNLLALNAAIEAARAGEHGRGFAVVADEVRKLAERTTEATKEVADSIRAIQNETEKAVAQMQECTDEVKRGVELATTAGDSLKQILSSSHQVQTMINSIAAAAEQQGAASDEVNRNIEGVSAVSREAAAGATQSASAAAQLSGKAESLQALVKRFRIDMTTGR